jgi:hypothetical protein
MDSNQLQKVRPPARKRGLRIGSQQAWQVSCQGFRFENAPLSARPHWASSLMTLLFFDRLKKRSDLVR